MTQYNFTTNIEHRMPDTGNVFCVDRMTSDYAEQHPLDVDGFIENVYQEFAGTEFEESRESLRSIWTEVLSVKSPRGDASLYPNNNGHKRAASMKVWLCAGDYWRRGFRLGDTLPDILPMTKISRLDNSAWIALFPKDKLLLENSNKKITEIAENNEPVVITEYQNDESPKEQKTEPHQLDLFAQLQQQNVALQARIAELERQARHRPDQEAHDRAERDRAERFSREAQARHRPDHQRSKEEHESPHAVAVTAPAHNHAWTKTAGYIAAASVALLVIWQTGLIIPLGLIGLATSGLLK